VYNVIRLALATRQACNILYTLLAKRIQKSYDYYVHIHEIFY
jgi:hypothetical protein